MCGSRVSPFERRVENRGEQKAMRTDFFGVLETRFDQAHEPLSEAIRKIVDTASLKALLKKAITAASLQEFEQGVVA